MIIGSVDKTAETQAHKGIDMKKKIRYSRNAMGYKVRQIPCKYLCDHPGRD